MAGPLTSAAQHIVYRDDTKGTRSPGAQECQGRSPEMHSLRVGSVPGGAACTYLDPHVDGPGFPLAGEPQEDHRRVGLGDRQGQAERVPLQRGARAVLFSFFFR